MHRSPTSANFEIYHIYNRGVEKRDIFSNDRDRYRFIHDLFEFNDKAPAPKIGSRTSEKSKKKRQLLVHILAFCMMPNHFHLMLRQVSDNGITEFMRKLGTGYTNYFNKKYERVGSLFQGKYKSVLITEEAHYIYLPYYIHFNPLKIKFPEWKSGKIKTEEALEFLEKYKWSSFLDFIGEKNFPSLIDNKFVSEFYGGCDDYKEGIKKWLTEISEVGLPKFEARKK